jgi:hypothetical protein
MTPTPEQWQDLLDAIAKIAPDPFLSTAIPIVTTFVAVFAGFFLAQWKDFAKAKQERRDKLREEVRVRRREVGDYLARWSHATDEPIIRTKGFEFSGVSVSELALLISLTGDAEDEQLTESIQTFVSAWRSRIRAAPLPVEDYGADDWEFTPEDVKEIEGFRILLLSLVRKWELHTLSPGRLAVELSELSTEIRASTVQRSKAFAKSQGITSPD